MREFVSFIKMHPELPILEISYESLSNDTTFHVKRIAEFMGIQCSDEKIEEVIQMCSFKNLKEADANYKENLVTEMSGGIVETVYRKGMSCIYRYTVL